MGDDLARYIIGAAIGATGTGAVTFAMIFQRLTRVETLVAILVRRARLDAEAPNMGV